jgi:formate C-acetyltransferase
MIESGLDRTWGGARYNFTAHPCWAGFPDVVNSLAAIKKFVFDEKMISMDELLDALDKNFEGKEELRQMLIHRAPKWGNDDDYVDSIAIKVAEIVFEAYEKVARINYRGGTIPRGVPNLTLGANVPFGKVVGALPSGRKAGEPLSDAISPTHGTDKNGPTAVLKSVAKLPYNKIESSILNMWFLPQALEKKLMHLHRYSKHILI